MLPPHHRSVAAPVEPEFCWGMVRPHLFIVAGQCAAGILPAVGTRPLRTGDKLELGALCRQDAGSTLPVHHDEKMCPTRPATKNLIVRRAQFINIARLRPVNYFTAMFNLTRQQQMFLCSVLLLLLVGWTVRAWRIGHPPERLPMTAAR